MPSQQAATRIARATHQDMGGAVTGGWSMEADVDFDSFRSAPHRVGDCLLFEPKWLRNDPKLLNCEIT